MRLYDIGTGDGEQVVSDRIVTIPNAISFLRICALPFIYLDIVRGNHVRALVVLAIFTSSDWFDGYIARRFDQITKLGRLLDPVSDRLLVAVVGIAMVVEHTTTTVLPGSLVPLWTVVLLLARDVAVFVTGIVLIRGGAQPPPVSRLGKTATFGIFTALPVLLLAEVLDSSAVRVVAFVGLLVNLVLYYVVAAQYARIVTATRR